MTAKSNIQSGHGAVVLKRRERRAPGALPSYQPQSRAGVSPARVGEADALLPRPVSGSLGRRDACPTLLAEFLSPSVFLPRRNTKNSKRRHFISAIFAIFAVTFLDLHNP